MHHWCFKSIGWTKQQTHQWSLPSRHKFHLVKVEVEEYQIIEEEEEAHTEVEEAALQAQMEGATIKIKVKAQAKIKHKVKGMINLKFNVIIVRSMVIMQINVERSNMACVANQVKIS